MILDNIARGRKKHLWVSTSLDLKNEASKDLADLGAPGVQVRDITELDAAHKALGLSKEFAQPACGMVLFCIYSSLTSSRRVSAAKADKGPKAGGGGGGGGGAKTQRRVDQLIEWLGGGEWDGVLALDEAHKVGVLSEAMYVVGGRGDRDGGMTMPTALDSTRLDSPQLLAVITCIPHRPRRTASTSPRPRAR
jgi:hypothetical protein